MQHPLHIAYAADDAYLTPTAVSLGSAVEACRNRAELAFDILDIGIGDDRWRSFESLLRDRLGDAFALRRQVMDVAKYRKLKPWHGSWGTYARLSRFRDRWPVRSVPALRDYPQRHYSRGCGILRHCGQSNRPRHLDTAAKE